MNCVDCEEYDKEKHYCPKFCNVIRFTVDEIRRDYIPVEWLKERYKTEGYYGTEEYFRKAYAVKEIIADWQAEQREDE